MADFENLPIRVQRIAKPELQPNEEIRLCALGRSSLLHPDFVLIIMLRVLILNEIYMGSLAISYPNIRCNVFFTEICTVKLVRFSKHRIFGQARLEIDVKRNSFWVDNMSFREARRAHQFITTQIQR